MSHPIARTADLTVRDLDSELIVHDHVTDRWHNLSTAGAAVFRAADGWRDAAALALATGLSIDDVEIALAALADAGLVTVPAGLSRRRLLAHGAAVSGVAAVLTVAAPLAANATSGVGGGGGGGGTQSGSTEFKTSAADGQPDPVVQQLVGSTYVAATGYANSNYRFIDGNNATYVGSGNGDNGTYRFRIRFVLPAGFNSVSITGPVRVDNGLIVRGTDGEVVDDSLNGKNEVGTFQSTELDLHYTGSGPFSPGTNYLFFDVQNVGSGPYGLLFDVTVAYT